jgi:hypothetical protein
VTVNKEGFVTERDGNMVAIAERLWNIDKQLRDVCYGKQEGPIHVDLMEESAALHRIIDSLRAKAQDWCGCGDSKSHARDKCENCALYK